MSVIVVDTDTTPEDATDGDAAVDNSIDVTLAPGEDDLNNDFVDEELGTISGNVSEDTDNDDVADSPIAGVTITLTDAAGMAQTTMTDADGNYEFSGLAPGEYTVTEEDETNIDADYVDVFDGDESSEDMDDAVDALNDDSIEVTLEAGENDEDNNFVEELIDEIMILGNVFLDPDQIFDNQVDGILGFIPSGINAVLVQVLDDGSEVIVNVMEVPGIGTPGAGMFSFDGVSNTTYYVLITDEDVVVGDMAPTSTSLPPSFFNTGENNGTGVGSDGTANGTSAPFTTSNVDVTDRNFGIFRFRAITVD